MLAFKTILHPTDFSESSKYALDLAVAMAADYHAHLVVIHVISAPEFFSGDGSLAIAGRGADLVRTRMSELEISDASIEVVRRVRAGNPATEILSVAKLCGADLIVMGTHGRNGLRRLLMGSVAEVVMRTATCPVLTVTPRVVNDSASIDVAPSEAATS